MAHKNSLPHKSDSQSVRNALKKYIISHLVSVTLGMILVWYRQSIACVIKKVLCLVADSIVANLEWFGGASPAGIKLHAPLCRLFSIIGVRYVEAMKKTSTFVLENLGAIDVILLGLACCSMTLGVKQASSILSWCIQIFSIPVTLAYLCCIFVYRMHFLATVYTWKVLREDTELFDSLKHFTTNYLWRRMLKQDKPSIKPIECHTCSLSSSVEKALNGKQCNYDHFFESLDFPNLGVSVAILLFIPLALTLPTTGWFAAFVSLLHFLSVGVSEAIAWLSYLAQGSEIITKNEQNTFLESTKRFLTGKPIVLARWRTVLNIIKVKDVNS